MTLPYVYFDRRLMPAGEASVSLACNSLQYGTTCFAGIKAYFRDGSYRVMRLRDHHERLMQASKILGMGYSIPYDAFHEIIRSLLEKNHTGGDIYIRPFIMAADEVIAPKPVGLNFQLAVYMISMDHYFDASKGMRLMVSSWRKFSDASLPTKAKAGGCYVNSFLATSEALRLGYDEALLMDKDGYIVEASVANIGMCYRNRVIMPPVGAAQLEGITMRTIIELLAEENIPVHHENIDRSMVYSCDEMWLMGTAAQVMPVVSVDDRPIGHGSMLVSLLREKFEKLIREIHPYITEF